MRRLAFFLRSRFAKPEEGRGRGRWLEREISARSHKLFIRLAFQKIYFKAALRLLSFCRPKLPFVASMSFFLHPSFKISK